MFLNPYFKIFKENISYLFQVIAAFLIPVKPLLAIVFLMIIIDTISGIWKAFKIKDPFTSKKLSQIVSKLVLYESGVILFFLLEKYLLGEFIVQFTSISYFLTKVIAIFFCSIELVSINENIKVVYGVNFFQMFGNLLSRAKVIKEEITDISSSSKSDSE